MSAIPAAADVLAPEIEVLGLAEVAERLGQPVNRVHQLLRDGQLLAERRDGVLVVPADFVAAGNVVKGLPGTITVLRDSGFSTEEMLRWLFTEDDTLPGSPIEALRGDRGREVKRRAQAMAF
ncbi:DNA-binding protein [Actinosynnema pretiosum subsp. pretiosum]|uniref:DNA-binding protein n=1 Tax=Actinosynnema pretiosum subsp. pretiosum TaxID=103721 RepID=A0AA45LAZ5_9PSEU|nr:Rv2175c family DNA-binding protein [Actinosynnema mirum]QUF06959.1 DNA-binding protein [Actinosynnema pretiosum subsp. pretiosum]